MIFLPLVCLKIYGLFCCIQVRMQGYLIVWKWFMFFSHHIFIKAFKIPSEIPGNPMIRNPRAEAVGIHWEAVWTKK